MTDHFINIQDGTAILLAVSTKYIVDTEKVSEINAVLSLSQIVFPVTRLTDGLWSGSTVFILEDAGIVVQVSQTRENTYVAKDRHERIVLTYELVEGELLAVQV